MLRKLLNKMGYYNINDLQTGGWCGCCGKWLPNAIVLKYWEWDLCDSCNK